MNKTVKQSINTTQTNGHLRYESWGLIYHLHSFVYKPCARMLLNIYHVFLMHEDVCTFQPTPDCAHATKKKTLVVEKWTSRQSDYAELLYHIPSVIFKKKSNFRFLCLQDTHAALGKWKRQQKWHFYAIAKFLNVIGEIKCTLGKSTL